MQINKHIITNRNQKVDLIRNIEIKIRKLVFVRLLSDIAMNTKPIPGLIDFCYEDLGTSIVCDGAFNDNHPPSNLISSSKELKTKGFLAEYYMKPPIRLSLEFEHPIHVCKIVLHPQVGEQQSQIFEVWASSSMSEPQKIGRSGGISTNYILFKNFYCREHPEAEIDNLFRLGPENSLNNITKLEVKIVKALKSGIPCLRNLEIWGYPSKSVPFDIVHSVELKWKSLIVPVQSISSKMCLEPLKPDLQDTSLPVDEEIPPEFLDSLTHTCMDVPMVLPCGQIVDRKTLDKYNLQEEEWGRLPNDPFTGKVFTSTSRPIFEAILKSRIDTFFLQRQGISKNALKRNNIFSDFADQSEAKISAAVEKKVGNSESTIIKGLEGRKLFILSNESASEHSCLKCKFKISLYKLTCSHLVCKNCISSDITITGMSCPKCQQISERKDISKHHSVNQ